MKVVRRGYELSVYDDEVKKLHARGIHIITHLILGLPGESHEDMKNSLEHVVKVGRDGVKLQLLHVLKGNDLADEYEAGKVPVMEFEEYIGLLCGLVPLIPHEMVIHRLTGDGDKKLLIAPLWSADKKRVLNEVNRRALPLVK